MNALSIVLCTFLMFYSIILIAILLWGLITSFKSTIDFQVMGNVIKFPNKQYSLDAMKGQNYIAIFNSFSYKAENRTYISAIFGKINDNPNITFNFMHLLLNSFVYSIIGALTQTFVSLLAGFLCAKYKFKFSGFIYVFMLIVMTVPIVGSYPSMLKLTRDLALYDTYVGMILLNFNFTGLYFFVFHAYFETLSNAYTEAAEIDGASQFGTFFRIIVPLASKTFLTVFLLKFILLWNDYQTIHLYYPNHPTLSYGVYKMSMNTTGLNHGFDTQSLPQRVAGCMILALPILVLFLSTKKLLLGNLTMGGIKE